MLKSSKQMSEAIERLIHIELKVDRLLESGREDSGSRAAVEAYAGHPDQVYGPSTYAQHGDDLIILNIFDAMEIERPSYIDIGAHHPVNISNTALLYKRGSRGVNVEANPNLIEAFHQLRPDDVNLNCGVSDQPGSMTFYMIDKWSGRNTFVKASAEQFVRENPAFRIELEIPIEVVTVDQIIEKHCGGAFPDFMSIDVEGLEYRILKSITYERWAPKLICAEICGEGRAEKEKEISEFLQRKGYEPVFRNRGNWFFVSSQYRFAVTGRVS